MNEFIKIQKEDGSIEYVNVNYDEMVLNTIENNAPIPEDIAQLTSEELESLVLESHKNFVRQERDIRLAESDWTQTIDSPLSEEKKVEWQTYRQLLRDIISTITNTTDIINWPTKP
jgi:hypothetical protein